MDSTFDALAASGTELSSEELDATAGGLMPVLLFILGMELGFIAVSAW